MVGARSGFDRRSKTAQPRTVLHPPATSCMTWGWRRTVTRKLPQLKCQKLRSPYTHLINVAQCTGGARGDALCAVLYAGGCGGWALFARDAGGVALCVTLYARGIGGAGGNALCVL